MLEIEAVTKRYGSTTVVADASLTARKGEVIALLGPSGCGKTTLLRMIASLVAPSAGEIRIEGQSIIGRRPHLSDASMLFQNYALFPFLTVERNVAFGLELRRQPRSQIAATVARMLDIVDLRGFERRRPGQLSGGQQQRVALARALAVSPKILLLDEPFSALDKKLRQETAMEVLRVIRELEMTTIFVTHDQDEALTMADRIAVMERGHIVQVASGVDVYARPETEFVAQFIGLANLVPGTVQTAAAGGLAIETELGLGASLPASAQLPVGVPLNILLRPENLRLTRLSGDRATAAGRVTFSIQFGSHTDYQVEVGKRLLKVRSAPSPLTAGDAVAIEIAEPEKCVFFQEGARVW
jgi:ABC-type Fe3+/spermidine/putrescine transport system ATPase subunit